MYVDSGVVFLRSQNVTETGLRLQDVAYIDDATHLRMAASAIFPFDVLLNITGASIGRCCYVPESLGPANVNQHVCTIRLPKPSLRDAQYLAAVLTSDIGQRQIFRLNAGGNREGLNYQQLSSFRIPWPPESRRHQIAEILSTVDEAIEQTEALIAKTQQIKAGLMHDLFTRGVTPDGRLRPPREEAPELYKESALGWIPREWAIETVGDLTTAIEQGWSPDCDSEPAAYGEWGVLKTSSVVWTGFEPLENKKLPSHFLPRSALKIMTGDVLMTRAGPNSRVGVVSLVDCNPGNLMLSDKLYRLIPERNVGGHFLAIALASENTQRELEAHKTGLAESQTNISQAIVRSLIIPFPQETERKAICLRSRRIAEHIGCLHELQMKLARTKRGLVELLLGGRTSLVSLNRRVEVGV